MPGETFYVTRIVIAGRAHFVLWGSGEGLDDRVELAGGRVAHFDGDSSARSFATDHDLDLAPFDAESAFDAGEIEKWLSGKRTPVPFIDALNLWNLGTDIAYSLGETWSPRSDDIYDKLFAANVPWAVGVPEHTPTWNPHQLKRLRAIISEAYGILRRALLD